MMGDSLGLGLRLPTFPLTTDGIDPQGSNILIERLNITNFDDSVVVKPSHADNVVKCSENILVRDIVTHWGVGLSIGSVGAGDTYPCVRNVTFKDSKLYHPFKGIYVKTNPGETKSM